MTNSEIELEAINIIKKEKEKWEDAQVQVTEKVRFRIRDLIRTCRMNYYGFFPNPVDQLTGRKKLWNPLTEEMCDAVSPKVGIQTKNVDFTATNELGYITAEVSRLSVREFLRNNYVGEIQDEDALNLCINGTVVRKTWMRKGKIQTRDVDLLNVFIDPTAKSIQDAYRFTERAVMFADEIAKTGWMNADKVIPSEQVPRIDTQYRNASTPGVPQVDVWEMYGKIPKYLITGDRKDKGDVDGHIIVSGIEAGQPHVHVLKLNTNRDPLGNVVKPYEEGWYIKVPGRWYGKGVAEKLMTMQVWLNLITNIRITRNTLSQLGIMKIRRGANITSSMISKMGVNGAISVNSMDDIEQLIIQEASESSYADERNVRDISQRLTSAFEVVTGENLPASTPATNAALMSQGAQGTFTAITNRNAMFVQRWIHRQLLPRLAAGWDTTKIANLFGSDEKFESLIERVAVFQVTQEMTKGNRIPTKEAAVAAVEELKDSYRRKGSLFISDLQELAISSIDTRVQVSDEDLDNAIVADKLIQVIQLAPEYKSHLIKQLFNVMGLAVPTELYRELGDPATNVAMQSLGMEQQSLAQGQQGLEAEQLAQMAIPSPQAGTDQQITQAGSAMSGRGQPVVG